MKKGHRFLSLEKKLLAIVFAVNLLFIFVTAVMNLWLNDQNEKESQKRDLEYIESVILPSLATAVWKLDVQMARVQTEGLLSNPNVVRVVVRENADSVVPFLDLKKSGHFGEIQQLSYDLTAPVADGGGAFAKMTLYTTLDPGMARMRQEMIRNLLSQGVQTLILSFLILYAFRLLVLNHLSQLSKFFKCNHFISKTTPRFLGKKPRKYRDEIDTLIEAVNRTIDESKKHQDQIENLKDRSERANQAKSMFLASINHELRTPLNAILGVTELLPESVHCAEGLQQLLDIQKRSGLHLLHLVDEILDFSKIEAGEVKIENSPMDIRTALQSCQMMMEAPIQNNGNRLEVSVDESVPKQILGDVNRINQVVINLVSNANKFTDKGLISVQVCKRHQDLEILVRDTGTGIPDDKLQEIFIPFRQLESLSGQTRKGTGIGLSITKKLIELMGGRIEVESKVGLGSLFRVLLPLTSAESECASKEPVDPQKPFRAQLELLVVEDTPEVQMMIKAFLRGTNIHLSFAKNGEEGVRRFKNGHYSLILMDLQMPVMDGFEATEQIRELEKQGGRQEHVPILALTALTTKNDLEQALKSGCDGYVTKPFSREKLLQTLQKIASAS